MIRTFLIFSFMPPIPFLLTGIIGSDFMAGELIQYGALGLCALLVGFICNEFRRQSLIHKEEQEMLIRTIHEKDDLLEKKDREITEMVKQVLDTRNRLIQKLEDRPCLKTNQKSVNI